MAQVNVRNRKRSDGSNNWEYRFEIAPQGGKRKRISKSGFKTKAEALNAGNEALNLYNNTGATFTASEISFSDFLDLYIEKYCKKELALTTWKGYEKKIRLYIKPALGQYRLKSITPMVLSDLLQSLKDNGYSRNTLIGVKGVLSGAFRYAVSPLRYLQASPMLYVTPPKSYEMRQSSSDSARKDGKTNGAIRGDNGHVYIEKQWIDKIFERFPEGHPAHLPLMLGYRLGLRLGEAFALTFQDFDFQNSTVSINKQVQYNDSKKCWYFKAPKYNSIRTISVDADLMEVIKRKSAQVEKDRLYYGEYYTTYCVNEDRDLGAEGTPINLINIRENGTYVQPRVMMHTSSVIHHNLGFKEFDFHSLRHTHATDLAAAGANPKYVQSRLGHKSIKVTLEIYQHLSPELEKQGSEILNKMYSDKKTP